MLAPASGDDWFALTDEVLPVAALYDWAVRPDCGAVVVFTGTVRDHADGRDGVEQLVYEAYERSGDDAPRGDRRRGAVALADDRAPGDGPSSRSARRRPNRPSSSSSRRRTVDEAFEAARFVIDTLKETVPIWKHETWRDGADWGTGAAPIRDVQHVGGGTGVMIRTTR